MDALAADPFTRFLLLIFAIGLVWLAVRFVFRLTIKLFLAGCSVIVFIGLAIFLLRFLAGG
jgi:hypothetical protein